MPFTLNSEVGAALGKLMPNGPPPQPDVGDVDTRRQVLTGMFAMLSDMAPAVEDVETKDLTTKAEDGHEIVCRWYTKKGHTVPGPAIVYAHGGGMIALQINDYDQVVKRYVTRTGVPFLSVEYRLAPEVKGPVPVTDTYAGLKYLVDHASELGVDTSRIAIMGDSAGGGITASLAHYIKLKGGPAVKKQILIYPMLDDRNINDDPDIAPYLTWTVNDNKTGWAALLGDKMGKDSVGVLEAAGRMTKQEAKGLPPCYMDVGELDLFRDEDIEYAQTLGKGGVECELHVLPGVPHAFQDMAPDAEVARTTMENRCRVIKSI